MTVHQVEEYYICIAIEGASKEAIKKACDHLDSEGFTNYNTDDNTLTVDDIGSEYEAEDLDDELNEILN